jgi:Cu(I)/Ag(I) efflux system membrane protein CusA/SilA
MPIMWSMGTGADVMKRVAAPMVGGLATSFLLELLVYPAVYLLWRKRQLHRQPARASEADAADDPGPAETT